MRDAGAAIATIIVVTHNSARFLERMISALEIQTETRWRLIIVDNASHESQRPLPALLPISATLIQNQENLGFAEANNIAAQAATTPYLVFLNPDAFPHPDWLEALISTAELYPEAGAIGSTQIRDGTRDIFDGAGDVMHASGIAYRASFGIKRTAPPPLGESFAVCAAAMLLRRQAFEDAGRFDASYFCYFEDVDLCFRLRLAGWRIIQSPDAVVAHVGGGVASQSSAFAQYHGARNRLWTFVKDMPAPLFWPLLPVHILLSAAVATLAILRGRGFSAWRGIIAGASDLSVALARRREVQRARTASSGEIARMLAWSPFIFWRRQPVIRPLPREAQAPAAQAPL